jgi:hypothetical protein
MRRNAPPSRGTGSASLGSRSCARGA